MFQSTRSLLVATVFTVCFSAPAIANENAAIFGKRADIEDVALSPDGSKIAFVAPGADRSNVLYVATTAGGTPKQVAQMDGKPEIFNWCDFVSNDRLICSIFAMVNYESILVPTSRLVSFDVDGTNIKAVGLRDGDFTKYHRTGGGEIVDWLDNNEEDVLLSWYAIPETYRTGSRFGNKDDGLGVYQFNARTGSASTVERPNKQADIYLADGEGNVRIMGINSAIGATGFSKSNISWKYRTTKNKKWLDLGSYNYLSNAGFYPQKIDPKTNSVYGLENDGTRDKLVKISLDGSLSKELVFEHPRYDVGGIVTLGQKRRPIGYGFADEAIRVSYFDKELNGLANALSKALPNLPSIWFSDATDDESKLLLRASSDTDPGRYYIFDKASKQLNELMLIRSDLENKKLAKVKPITFKGRDGISIPGYLTIPFGSTGKNLPAIVMPHGGPGARDIWGFDWWAQFYAAEGYAVIQPNFRGSTGYGQEWFNQNGWKNWKSAISDVNDAGKWMINEGIADPEKMAIVGWSYGGYAALQSAVFEPDLFKAVIAVAPVTDIGEWAEEFRQFSNYTTMKKYIGSGPHLTAGSPAQNAEKIKAPVMMFHGNRDFNVKVSQSKRMVAALKTVGKQVEFVEYDNLEHGLRQTEARTDMLTKSSAFLKQHLSK